MEEQEEEEHPSVVESKTKKAEATVQVRRNNILTFSVESERSFCRSRFHKCIILILPKTEHLISSVNEQLIRAKQPASPIFHHMLDGPRGQSPVQPKSSCNLVSTTSCSLHQ